jgi:hypothetical protein
MRETWTSPKKPNSNISLFDDKPICYRYAADLLREAGGDSAKKEALLQIVTKRRQCVSFETWRPGLNLKELYDMLQNEQLLKWQEEQKRIADEREDKRKKEDRRWQLKVAIAAAIFSLVNALIVWEVGRYAAPTQPVIIQVPIEHKGDHDAGSQ